mmetsp:Transcript_29418/g.44453  ORF Transcript_29418/g.44453 Transcript_29418/m.44453 type:complete len:110 (+) Transcript_29418:90-419(+)
MVSTSLIYILVGFAMLLHAGSGLIAEKAAAELIGDETDGAMPTAVYIEVLVGAALAMWGSIGDFKPIRLNDSKKPRWESLHLRPDFQCYGGRTKLLRSVLEPNFPPVPK